MSAMEPVLAHHTLNHLVIDRILGIRIRSMAETIDSREILIVQIFIVRFGFVGVQATPNGKDFRGATIASERALRVQLHHVMADVTVVGTSQADTGPLLRIGTGVGRAR